MDESWFINVVICKLFTSADPDPVEGVRLILMDEVLRRCRV